MHNNHFSPTAHCNIHKAPPVYVFKLAGKSSSTAKLITITHLQLYTLIGHDETKWFAKSAHWLLRYHVIPYNQDKKHRIFCAIHALLTQEGLHALPTKLKPFV